MQERSAACKAPQPAGRQRAGWQGGWSALACGPAQARPACTLHCKHARGPPALPPRQPRGGPQARVRARARAPGRRAAGRARRAGAAASPPGWLGPGTQRQTAPRPAAAWRPPTPAGTCQIQRSEAASGRVCTRGRAGVGSRCLRERERGRPGLHHCWPAACQPPGHRCRCSHRSRSRRKRTLLSRLKAGHRRLTILWSTGGPQTTRQPTEPHLLGGLEAGHRQVGEVDGGGAGRAGQRHRRDQAQRALAADEQLLQVVAASCAAREGRAPHSAARATAAAGCARLPGHQPSTQRQAFRQEAASSLTPCCPCAAW